MDRVKADLKKEIEEETNNFGSFCFHDIICAIIHFQSDTSLEHFSRFWTA
jgi:hypothetical protein